jgi:glycosyltransferase involved in cell wall biosynthesis
MRLALLHTRLSGYLAACLRELKRRGDAELLIHAYPPAGDAPFDPGVFADLGEVRNRREHADDAILRAVLDFGPDAVLVSGWGDKGYLKICRELRRRGIAVIAGCDTQWTGGLRQHVASWIAPWHLHKAIDVLWVTGERQAVLGRALGFSGDRLWDGYYACDWARFATPSRPSGACGASVVRRPSSVVGEQPSAGNNPAHDDGQTTNDEGTFLYVGRYVPEKGIDTLAEAYGRYRERVDEPWKLVCAGSGPLGETLVAAGAEDRGFVQPRDLPGLMHEAGAFVLPSRFEPWGVVVHEAAASGLPLICSDACGAAVHLLRDRFNGFLFPAGDAAALAERMVALHELSDARRVAFAEASFELSKQYTPARWTETLLAALRPSGGLEGNRRVLD